MRLLTAGRRYVLRGAPHPDIESRHAKRIVRSPTTAPNFHALHALGGFGGSIDCLRHNVSPLGLKTIHIATLAELDGLPSGEN